MVHIKLLFNIIINIRRWIRIKQAKNNHLNIVYQHEIEIYVPKMLELIWMYLCTIYQVGQDTAAHTTCYADKPLGYLHVVVVCDPGPVVISRPQSSSECYTNSPRLPYNTRFCTWIIQVPWHWWALSVCFDTFLCLCVVCKHLYTKRLSFSYCDTFVCLA